MRNIGAGALAQAEQGGLADRCTERSGQTAFYEGMRDITMVSSAVP